MLENTPVNGSALFLLNNKRNQNIFVLHDLLNTMT